jgi:hypothetical protein
MSKPWTKYLDVFKNADKIAEGIKNNMFKKEHVEAIFTDRYQICAGCSLLDLEGTSCLAPGSQPCCSDCGCSLDFKLRSLSSECPKGHWLTVTSEEEEELINQQIQNNEHTS